MEFFENMDPLLQTFWYIALGASLIFIIQTIMTFAGMDSSDGVEADFNSDLSDTDAPFQLFSFRNLINFLMGFSWGGISFYKYFDNKIILSAIAVMIGLAFVGMFFLIIKQIQKLAEDNTFKINDTVNLSATVYLSIPGEKKGKGKIQVSVKGSTHELDAMTEGEKIETGAVVKIIRTEGANLVFVNKI